MDEIELISEKEVKNNRKFFIEELDDYKKNFRLYFHNRIEIKKKVRAKKRG